VKFGANGPNVAVFKVGDQYFFCRDVYPCQTCLAEAVVKGYSRPINLSHLASSLVFMGVTLKQSQDEHRETTLAFMRRVIGNTAEALKTGTAEAMTFEGLNRELILKMIEEIKVDYPDLYAESVDVLGIHRV
jgi:hypothetical protein